MQEKSLFIKDYGENNLIELNEKNTEQVRISIKGSNNRLIVSETAVLRSLKIEIEANNSEIFIGQFCKIIGHLRIASGKNQSIIIGDYTTFQNVYLLTMEEGRSINIGSHCMFSRGIEIRTSDAHSVICSKTGKRLNQGESVSIGNHVWIAAKAFVSKGVVIGDDNIIGAGTIVTKSFPESNIAIAGIPAKIVKRDVTWNRSRKDLYTMDELNDWKKFI